MWVDFSEGRRPMETMIKGRRVKAVHLDYYYPEDGGKTFLRNAGNHLQQQQQQQFTISSRENLRYLSKDTTVREMTAWLLYIFSTLHHLGETR
jgi:hypothetical protein